MNISRIIRKVLLEEDEKLKADALDQNVSYQYLRTVVQGCPTIARGAFTQRPIYTLENEMLKKKMNELNELLKRFENIMS